MKEGSHMKKNSRCIDIYFIRRYSCVPLHQYMLLPLTSILVRPKHCDPMFLLRTLGERYDTCALLESLDRNHAKNDFSFLALGSRELITISDGTDPLTRFETLIGKGQEGSFLSMGYIGFLSFEAMRMFDAIALTPDPDVPDACFFLPEILLKIDHEKRIVTIVTHADTNEDLAAIKKIILRSPYHDDAKNRAIHTKQPPMPDETLVESLRQTPRKRYVEHVRKAQEEILKGEAFQIVLSQELRLQNNVPAIDVYQHLRQINPSPYMYYFKTPERTIVGASPETLIRVDGRKMLYRPIAGTRKRTGDPATDERMKRELLADPKERAEHQMLVDLGRNDLGRIATIGSVAVRNPFHLEAYAHVIHIVSDITAELQSGCSSLDALRSVFPAGTLTGAPKLRAIEILRNLEGSPRGIYGGAFGYIDLTGNLDFAITIRTMLFDARGISLRVGAGIVKDSIPEREDEECMHKAKSCLAAIFAASQR